MRTHTERDREYKFANVHERLSRIPNRVREKRQQTKPQTKRRSKIYFECQFALSLRDNVAETRAIQTLTIKLQINETKNFLNKQNNEPDLLSTSRRV